MSDWMPGPMGAAGLDAPVLVFGSENAGPMGWAAVSIVGSAAAVLSETPSSAHALETTVIWMSSKLASAIFIHFVRIISLSSQKISQVMIAQKVGRKTSLARKGAEAV